MRYGINGSGRMLTHGVAGVLDHLRTAEEAGFASYWVAQVGLVDAARMVALIGESQAALGDQNRSASVAGSA